MALKTIVKVGTVTNLSDARYCAGMGVDMLGFVAVKGKDNFLPATEFQNIRGWITGPKIVAEIYGVNSQTDLDQIIEEYRPDYLELGISEFTLLKTELPVLLHLNKSDFPDQIKNFTNIEYFILDLERLEAVKNQLPGHGKILFKSDQSPLPVSLLESNRIHGIVLNGTQEEKPGLKDYDHIAEVLESLEVD